MRSGIAEETYDVSTLSGQQLWTRTPGRNPTGWPSRGHRDTQWPSFSYGATLFLLGRPSREGLPQPCHEATSTMRRKDQLVFVVKARTERLYS